MSEAFESLQLDHSQLTAVRDALAERVRAGLAAPDGEIRALPAWLPEPGPELRGQAVVVDTGGTNMRAALVELEPGKPPRVSEPVGDEVPRDPERRVGAEEFFRQQAELVRRLDAPPGLPVGYCFSYPTSNQPDGDATLLHWTKGIQIQGVEGEPVGAGLRQGMEQLGLAPGPVWVLNDTVASLMAGAWQARGQAECIGLIVGTGTNMAAFLQREGLARMAINLESGNFHPPGLSVWDDELDGVTDNPGQQRFEKAVSGYYLPYLFRRLYPNFTGVDPAAGSAQLGQLRRRSGPKGRAATLLLDRSADLVGAAIAGLSQLFPAGRPIRVVAEGGLYWKTAGYSARVLATAQRLLGAPHAFQIESVDHANLVGSACAALLGSRG